MAARVSCCRSTIMRADQWDAQATIKRVNESLIARGYLTWFDLTNMKGSTIDAMSDAIDGAAVMLFGVSLAYKESANCRLEASCLCACRVVCIQQQRLTSSCSAGQLRPSTGAGHDPIDGAEGLLAEGMA